MIELKVLSVRDPKWVSEDMCAINCWITTNTLVGEVPFTATPYDSEPHGREVYAKCLAGEFGDIAPMEPRVALDTLLQQPLPAKYQRLERFLAEANRENSRQSFRSVVIVWASLLEQLLDETLKGYAQRNRYIAGLPKNFDGRIERAFEWALISQVEAEKCHIIRRIRNAAAHDWELTLTSKHVFPSLKALHMVDHSTTVVFHEDLDFLLQQVYGPSCAMMVMKLFDQLPNDWA